MSQDEKELHNEEFVNNGVISYGQDYNLPESKEAYLDPTKGAIVDKKDISPFEIIKALAEQTGTIIQKPKSGCRSCHGRGYTSRDLKTQMPIPCACIYPTKNDNDKINEKLYDDKRVNERLNNAQRRNLKKALMKEQKKFLKIKKDREARGFYNPPTNQQNNITDEDIVND